MASQGKPATWTRPSKGSRLSGEPLKKVSDVNLLASTYTCTQVYRHLHTGVPLTCEYVCTHPHTHYIYTYTKKSAEKSVGLVIVLILCNIFLKRYTYVTFAFMYG